MRTGWNLLLWGFLIIVPLPAIAGSVIQEVACSHSEYTDVVYDENTIRVDPAPRHMSFRECGSRGASYGVVELSTVLPSLHDFEFVVTFENLSDANHVGLVGGTVANFVCLDQSRSVGEVKLEDSGAKSHQYLFSGRCVGDLKSRNGM